MALNAALSDPKVLKSLEAQGLVAVKSRSPEDFSRMVSNDYRQWGEVVQAAGVKVE